MWYSQYKIDNELNQMNLHNPLASSVIFSTAVRCTKSGEKRFLKKMYYFCIQMQYTVMTTCFQKAMLLITHSSEQSNDTPLHYFNETLLNPDAFLPVRSSAT